LQKRFFLQSDAAPPPQSLRYFHFRHATAANLLQKHQPSVLQFIICDLPQVRL
jgi:hypothetical protein